jgi:hypothetical protein
MAYSYSRGDMTTTIDGGQDLISKASFVGVLCLSSRTSTQRISALVYFHEISVHCALEQQFLHRKCIGDLYQ